MRTEVTSAKPAEIDDDCDAIEWELIELVEEHGSERQALRALLHDFHALLDVTAIWHNVCQIIAAPRTA